MAAFEQLSSNDRKVLLWMGSFIGTHTIMSHSSIRDKIIASVTQSKFPLLYSLVSLVTLIPPTYIYFRSTKGTGDKIPFLENSSDIFMKLGLFFAVHAAFHIPLISSSKPLTYPGITAQERDKLVKSGKGIRGILRITRHPLFVMIGVFSLSQIFRGQRYSDLCYYFPLLFECIWGSIHQDLRLRNWYEAQFFSQTSGFPFVAVLNGKQSLATAFKEVGTVRIAVGSALGAATYWYLTK